MRSCCINLRTVPNRNNPDFSQWKFMGPTWGLPGSCRPDMGLMLAPWTLLSGMQSKLPPHFTAARSKAELYHTSNWPVPVDTRMFVNEKICILIKIPLHFVPKGPIDNIPATSHYLNQCWPDSLPHIYGTRGRWVKYELLQNYVVHHTGPWFIRSYGASKLLF